MTIQSLLDALNEWAPFHLAESYDNVGLLVGSPLDDVKGVLVSLDVTDLVLDEALSLNCNVIVSHHPIWFESRKNLTGGDLVSRCIIQSIKQDLHIVAMHTNLDTIREGVNRKIADKLQLRDTAFILPGALYGTGAGRYGLLPTPMYKYDFLALLKETFHCQTVRYSDIRKKDTIEKVGVCGGAGSFLIQHCHTLNLDAFVSADITYHKFFLPDHKFLLADIGHYESEQYTSELIVDYLSEKFTNFAIHFSSYNTNPVSYY